MLGRNVSHDVMDTDVTQQSPINLYINMYFKMNAKIRVETTEHNAYHVFHQTCTI